jgi:hypothetical protein
MPPDVPAPGAADLAAIQVQMGASNYKRVVRDGRSGTDDLTELEDKEGPSDQGRWGDQAPGRVMTARQVARSLAEPVASVRWLPA